MSGLLTDMTAIATTHSSAHWSMCSASAKSSHSTLSRMSHGYAASQLTSTVSTYSRNLTKTSFQKIIGRRCRCAGCRALRPEKRAWCVVNGKWRWVILTLLAIMIFLLGKATQPGEGGRKNVSMQRHLVLAVMSRPELWDLASRSSPDTNFMMLINARHHFVQWFSNFFWHVPNQQVFFNYQQW